MLVCLVVMQAGGFNGQASSTQLLVRDRAFGVWRSGEGGARASRKSRRQSSLMETCLRHLGILHFRVLVVKIVCQMKLSYLSLQMKLSDLSLQYCAALECYLSINTIIKTDRATSRQNSNHLLPPCGTFTLHVRTQS